MSAGLDEKGLVIGRKCGTCSLCCKVYDINWLDKPKPAGKWCHNCKPGQGCAIWQSVPQKCEDYFCGWRTMPQLGEEWRPDKSGFIVHKQAPHMPYEVIPDPGRPNSWRAEPYYSQLRRAAQSAIEQGTVFVVQVAGRQTILLPDGEIPVPPGAENTDFKMRKDPATGRWGVTFIARQQSA